MNVWRKQVDKWWIDKAQKMLAVGKKEKNTNNINDMMRAVNQT